MVALIFYSAWLHFTHSAAPDKYSLTGPWPRGLQGSSIAAAALCVLIPLFQLNARLGEQALPLSQGAIAPHELAGRCVCSLFSC